MGQSSFVTDFDEVVVVEAEMLEVMDQCGDETCQYLISSTCKAHIRKHRRHI
jgi:hypothetical protein